MKNLLTHYKVDDVSRDYLNFLSLSFSHFAIIPLSDEAKKHVMGVMNFANEDVVFLKSKAMEEVLTFYRNLNIGPTIVNVAFDQVLWYISMLEVPDEKLYVTAPWIYQHPRKELGKVLTYNQCVSLWSVNLRNIRERNIVEIRGWDRDTLMIYVKYICHETHTKTGGITIGIEPDGYTHS